MQWWLDLFPVLPDENGPLAITYHRQTRTVETRGNNAQPDDDRVMLVRKRLSRIFYLRKFFPYPITLSVKTLLSLGLLRTFKIGFSYIYIRLFPIKKEKNLEDFFINRFGKELYQTFFKDYTEKVWGIACTEISPEWGAQRIKGVSIAKAIKHALLFSVKKEKSIAQKNIETSLIEKFLYPKLGPGQLWEEVARLVQEKGGEIHLNSPVSKIFLQNNRVDSVATSTGNIFKGHHFFSTMPVKDLIQSIEPEVSEEVRNLASGLQYRDFITVGLLVKKLKVHDADHSAIKDNWIYIQENDVKIGRLQVFNNWSPYMVQNPEYTWMGLEYFCNEGDEIWNKTDAELLHFAIDELHKISIIDKVDFLDGTVVRMPKTYPAYFGTYTQFDTIRNFTDSIENLYLVGRNGMHKYNNQDHSMLTAITAVENIKNGITSRNNIWEINTEMEYHEEK